MRGRAGSVVLAAAFAAVFHAQGRSAADDTRMATAWRVTEAEVRVICPLTVGGSFEARTRALTGTLALADPRPPRFTGQLSVDLRTLDSDLALRDMHLRDEYLEVARGAGFESAILSDLRLPDADAASAQGKLRFTGMLRLHGVGKAVAGRAVLRRAGGSTTVLAEFPVTLADFAIAEPRYLGVGVAPAVQVKVSFTAVPAPDEAKP